MLWNPTQKYVEKHYSSSPLLSMYTQITYKFFVIGNTFCIKCCSVPCTTSRDLFIPNILGKAQKQRHSYWVICTKWISIYVKVQLNIKFLEILSNSFCANAVIIFVSCINTQTDNFLKNLVQDSPNRVNP